MIFLVQYMPTGLFNHMSCVYHFNFLREDIPRFGEYENILIKEDLL